jgi:hypothetical protein
LTQMNLTSCTSFLIKWCVLIILSSKKTSTLEQFEEFDD